jgi:hypothetical protein
MLFFLLLFDVSSLEAVYFANDTFILYEDGQRVLDSGVICTNEKDGGNWVCHCGVLVVSQHDLKKTFYRTKEKVVKSWHAWVRSFEDQEYAYQNVDEFRKYMQSLKEQSEYRVTLSFLAASGGIAAPPGFCGGRIGDPRTFQVDLKKKTVIEIKDESLPQDIRQLVKEVREMDRNGEL